MIAGDAGSRWIVYAQNNMYVYRLKTFEL